MTHLQTNTTNTPFIAWTFDNTDIFSIQHYYLVCSSCSSRDCRSWILVVAEVVVLVVAEVVVLVVAEVVVLVVSEVDDADTNIHIDTKM